MRVEGGEGISAEEVERRIDDSVNAVADDISKLYRKEMDELRAKLKAHGIE